MVVSISAAAWVFAIECALFGLLRKYLIEQSTLMLCFVLAAIVFLFAATNADDARKTLVSRSLREIEKNSITAAWASVFGFSVVALGLLLYRSNPVTKTLSDWNKSTHNLLLLSALTVTASLFLYKAST